MKNLLATLVLLSFLPASQAASEVETAEFVDLKKYIGTWFEIASIPQSFAKQCVANTTAVYSFDKDDLVKVVNSCDTKTGDRSIAEGRAKVLDTNSNAKLKVTFVKLLDWVFTFGGNYWILDVDPGYNYALVGDPSRDYAWILSRIAILSNQNLIKAEAKFQEQGYDTCKILTSIQSAGISQRIPLCDYVKNLN